MKKLLSLLLILALFLSAIPLTVLPASALGSEDGNNSAAVTYNLGDQNYPYYWAQEVKSYLIENSDGTLSRIEAMKDGVTVEGYSADFEFLSRRMLPIELPIWGGFYEGTDSFFLVFGQNNREQDDSKEVVRVVRYSKTWERQGYASLLGANTTAPFDAGSLRMTQYGDMLYVHTCHEMYESSDGLNHQANMIFSVHIPTMEITDQYTKVMNVNYGYVSHSFNQFILTDGDKLLTLNHGDAYPRSAVIVQYGKPAGQQTFTGKCTNTSVLDFAGTVGQNATGATLGAFELSDSSILVAGSSIVQDGSADFYSQKNIFITATDRGDIGTKESTFRWVTDHAADAGIDVSNPHMIRIRDDYFLLLWTENDLLHYVFTDGSGNTVSRIYEANMPLSDCKPFIYNEKVCWYVTQNTQPVFYTISVDSPEQTEIHDFRVTVVPPTCIRDGYTSHACSCGNSYVTDRVDALGHNYEKGICTRCGMRDPDSNYVEFSDVSEKAWYKEAVDYAVANGLMNGTGNNKFEPDSPMTRAMLVTVLWRYAGSPEEGINVFTDVKNGQWYTKAVAWAAHNSIVGGVGGGRFDPDGKITREQMAAILYRYSNAVGIDTSKREALDSFPDGGKVSSYATEAISWAVAEGLITGSRTGSKVYLDPQGNATRAQVATILMRFIEWAQAE